MNYSYDNGNANEFFLNHYENDIILFNIDNECNLNESDSLEMERDCNVFDPNFPNLISSEGAWNIGGNTGITEKDNKSKACEKFTIDKLQYSEKEINDIIKNMNINNAHKTKFYLELDSKDSVILEIKYQLNLKVRIRRMRRKINNKYLLKLKAGRRQKDEPTNINNNNHNKYSSDNIIKAIKTKLNDSIINFTNKIINYVYRNNKEKLIEITGGLNNNAIKKNSKYIEVIKKIDYNTYANKTNKKFNLALLSQTIKEYLSINISKRYKNLNEEYNKIIMDMLLQDEENNSIFSFIFNKIKIEDWLDFFVYKKELEFHGDSNLKDNQIEIIKENLVRIDDIDNNVLYEICENDKLYFHCFMLLLYNFRRFFELKEDRKEKKKKEK